MVLKRNGSTDILGDSFIVLRLDHSTSSWVEMKTLGNRVLFLGPSCCASFNPTELGCRGNQIYFTEPLFDNATWRMFNVKNDGSIESGFSSYDIYSNGEYVLGDDPLWINPTFV